ncbi:unnamed protein product [Coffea canephora]|uniref:Uncharacterized protein n=1 Tax=Coffea canephora TaxID=49390 RepID=A0A068VJ43_COFCA|nr:unnamed protein product [Coffea canephora]
MLGSILKRSILKRYRFVNRGHGTVVPLSTPQLMSSQKPKPILEVKLMDAV